MDSVVVSSGNPIRRVQELAETGNGEPPPRYIQSESNRPTVDPPPCTIPIVDLSLLPQPEEADKLRSALQSWGLFQAVGHGIPTSLLHEIWNVGWLFFHQPMQEKQRHHTSAIDGYGNDKVVADEQILDWSDRLHFQVLPEKERKVELWPETPASFRDTLCEYSDRTRAMVDAILKSLAMVLGLEEDCFSDQLDESTVLMSRFNFYPRCSRPELVFGLKPHADATVLTVLLQDPDVEGLQVLSDRLGWVKVPIVPNALVVNVGDELEILSNGEYKSPVHRAVTSSERERMSLAMFYLYGEKDVEPATGLVTEGKTKLYKKVNGKEYLERYMQDFYQGKRAIDSVKVRPQGFSRLG